MASITGAHHTSYTVGDMARSLAFYRDLLGFNVISDRPEVTNTYFRTIIGFPDGVIHAVMLEIPGTKHYLELFEYKHPRGTPQDMSPNNPNSSHICYLVDDLPPLYERLVSAGVQFVSPPVEVDAGPNAGGMAVYMKDPDGVVIELFQAPLIKQY
jgi:catechol 2,3-dioxygenase-like lactoylglutathione lyase family enzyme